MMVNFFKKQEWTKKEWLIYLNNLNVLRLYSGLAKKEFSKKVGRANLFRQDMGRPGEATILKICQEFNVTETWLSTPRAEAIKYIKTHPALQLVAEPRPSYGTTEQCPFQDQEKARRIKEDLVYIEKTAPDEYTWLTRQIFGIAADLRFQGKKTKKGT